uniref:Uncharacterized protein n=1 Tax=Chromera velia CCMP2878 TaxID=1169474 RepID=A0A0G4FA60_9ALVE|eukprot:Cvel_15979.t1-p1 / transcript=Cvel_15979.t1 / gene=Cvel_15979 / organism=Chromera_velia_CCMP2878 / gene_product=hypothetical protein / transcript_product=hypothetical protein / location=Cvel_scaffold1210:10421-12691(+) / protein_length=215 / sequence_SO=supercontig / SO=protein_coding / is_pseudo=false
MGDGKAVEVPPPPLQEGKDKEEEPNDGTDPLKKKPVIPITIEGLGTKEYRVSRVQMNWKEVWTAVHEIGDLELLARSEDQVRHYMKSTQEMLTRFGEVVDRVLVEILGVPQSLNEKGLVVAVKSEKVLEEMKSKRVLRRNDFPYFFSEEIECFVLWTGEPIEEAEARSIAEASLDPRVYEFIIFENPVRLRSVPGVSHWHILVRTKPTTDTESST